MRDLFDCDEAGEVAHLVGLHQIVDEFCFGNGVAELKGEVTEAVVDVAVDVRVKSDGVHSFAGLTGGVFNEGHQRTL